MFGGDGTHYFARKTSHNYEKEKPSPFPKKFLRQSQSSTPELEPKKQNSIQLGHNHVDTSLVDTVDQNFNSILVFCILSPQ